MGVDDSGWLLRVEHRLLGRLSWRVASTSGFSGVERDAGVVGGLGTLLGPEGAGDASRSVLQRRPRQLLVGVVVVRLGLAWRPYRV